MWKHLLGKCHVLTHGSLRREWITSKQCMGIVNGDNSTEIPVGTLLSAIPITSCPSASLFAQSEWKSLASRIPGYEVSNGESINFHCDESTVQTVVFVALLSSSASPLGNYIRFIANEVQCSTTEWIEKVPKDLLPLIQNIEKMKEKMLEDLSTKVLRASGPMVPVSSLRMANYLCESRCVEVPSTRHDLFDGPALVPFLDLLNHSEKRNVAVSLYPAPQLRLERKKSLIYPEISRSDLDNHMPFYVAVHASEIITPGEELSYPYIEGTESISEAAWLSRFHFLEKKGSNEELNS